MLGRTNLRLWLGHLRRNLPVNLLNLLGLTLGLAAALLSVLYIERELLVDSQHEDPDRVVRLWVEATVGAGEHMRFPTAASATAPQMASRLEGIEAWTRMWIIGRSEPVRHGEQVFLEDNVTWADSSLFEVLAYPLVLGDPATALVEPQSVVLSEQAAKKYFGEENALGGEILFNNRYRYQVTGVFHRPEQGTHLPDLDIIASWSSLDLSWLSDDGSMLNNMGNPTYFKLAPGVDRHQIEQQCNRILLEREREVLDAVGGEASIHLQPIRRAYLHSPEFMFGGETHGSFEQLLQIGAIGLLALLVAMINSINLVTAVSARRARTVGVSKALGATRGQLLVQYLGESVAMGLLALLLALLLVQLSQGAFEELAGRSLGPSPWSRPGLLLLSALAVVGVGLLSGLYPALLISGQDPALVLKGQLGSGHRGTRLRSTLVVLQFAVSVVLIASTLVMHRQTEFMRNKRLGYDQERVLFLPLADDVLRDQYETLMNELRGLPQVQFASGTQAIPHYSTGQRMMHLPGSGDEGEVSVRTMVADDAFLEVMGMELLEGRSFRRDRDGEAEAVLLVNESAVREFGWSEGGMGKVLQEAISIDPVRYRDYQVVGVLRDFHFETMHEPIRPLVMFRLAGVPEMIALRLAPGDPREQLAAVEELWHRLSPSALFDFTFLDARFDWLYRKELRQGSLFALFAGVAIFIACLGLVALAAYAAAARRREIGMRKVLGASEGSIVLLLVRQFVLLVLIANAIALPAAWLLMRRWLEQYAYRIELGPALFGLSLLISLAVALLVVSGQAIRAATTDPVRTLRHE